jgi:hypothetical protein
MVSMTNPSEPRSGGPEPPAGGAGETGTGSGNAPEYQPPAYTPPPAYQAPVYRAPSFMALGQPALGQPAVGQPAASPLATDPSAGQPPTVSASGSTVLAPAVPVTPASGFAADPSAAGQPPAPATGSVALTLPEPAPDSGTLAAAAAPAPASTLTPAGPSPSARPWTPAGPSAPASPLTSASGFAAVLPRAVTSLHLPALDPTGQKESPARPQIPPARPLALPGHTAGPSADAGDSPIYEEMRAAAERRLPGYQEAMSRYLPPDIPAPPTRPPARRPAPQGRQKTTSSRPAATRRPAPPSRPTARQQASPRKPPSRVSSRPSQPARPSRPPASRPRGGGTFGVKAVLIIIGAIFALVVGRAVLGQLANFGGGSASSEAPAPQPAGNPGGTSAGTGTAPGGQHERKASGPIRTVFRIRTVQGSVMTVQLVKLLDPARPQSFLDDPGPGKHLVGAVFTVRGVRGAVDDDAYNDAVLIGSNGKRYQWSFADLAGHHPAFTDGTFRLRPGQRVSGTVTAVLPDGVRVVRVRWTSSSGFGQAVTWHLKRPR